MTFSFLAYFNRGHERSVKAKKNIFFLALIRLVGILISLLLVRVAVDYVDKVQYGIWLTVSSIVAWMAFFDIGLSNGMRNKFAEAISQGDEKTAKIYVSTTYFSLLCIFLSLWIIFISVHQSLDWCTLLNLPETSSADIHILILIVFSYFCIQFVLRTIMTVLTANQEPAKASLIDVLGQLFSLLIIFVLIKTTQGSLIYLGLGLTIAPLIVLIVANLWFFNGRYKEYAPALSSFKLSYFKNIWGLSFKFFIIQVAALVQYQTANIIIARSFSMESVTDYNIVYKYFNVLLMGFTILITPFWSAATEAYAKNDFAWIKNAVKRYNHVLFFFITGGAVMWLLSGFIYDIWMGKDVISIPFQMSLWCLIYVLTSLYGSIYVNLLNGIGSVKIQYYSSLITPFLFIALCWIFINRLHWGVYSLFIASIISNLNGIVLAPIQYKKIFIEGKGGIWKA